MSAPYLLYGLNPSPYSVKMRAILRYRRIPFVWNATGDPRDIAVKAGLPPVIPILRFPDGRLQHVASYMPKLSYCGQFVGGEEKDINQYAVDQEVDSVIFAAAYIKRALLDAIGPLDSEYSERAGVLRKDHLLRS